MITKNLFPIKSQKRNKRRTKKLKQQQQTSSFHCGDLRGILKNTQKSE
jgi:hypothetical protein